MTTTRNDETTGIYVHIPFCVRKCPYCGFYSEAVGKRPEGDVLTRYFDALKKELSIKTAAAGLCGGPLRTPAADTIYFGGGTPSLAGAGRIAEMIETLKGVFAVPEDAEISIEANPGTVDYETLKEYREAGVNRLSIGAQSFDDGVLGVLGRIHTAEDAVRAYEDARRAGFENVSLDLIFSVPGMDLGTWMDTVRTCADLAPDHISAYSLQFEEGTPFYDRLKAGTLEETPDELDRKMYHEAIRYLGSRGCGWYEISNFAKPGMECRHNVKYWRFSDYLGLGAGASSFVNGVRTANLTAGYPDAVEKAYDAFTGGQRAEDAQDLLFSEKNVNTREDDMGEYLFTGLRMLSGIDLSDFRRRFGEEFEDAYAGVLPELREYEDAGCIKKDAGRLFLTEKGIDISNQIMALFV